MAKIMVDPGHGGNAPGAVGPTGLKEKDINLSVSRKLGELLVKTGHKVSYTRTTDINPSVTARAAQANSEKVDYFISIHCNSNSSTAVGIETIVFALNSTAHRFATPIQREMVLATGDRDRGVKADSKLAVLRGTNMPACLPEIGFISHRDTEAKLRTNHYQELIAGAIAKGVNTFLGIVTPPPGVPEPSDSLVLGHTNISAEQAEEWARGKNATHTFQTLAGKYWRLAPSHGEVNPALAFAQAALETGHGRFGGVIDESFHNPCGLKVKAGGDDKDPNAHQRFKDWTQGVQAHLDHLALYAAAEGYPRSGSPDPRHFDWLAGKGVTIEAMAKSWCPGNPRYAETLERMMHEMSQVKLPPPEEKPSEMTASFQCPHCNKWLRVKPI